jgi:hypothetical protein
MVAMVSAGPPAATESLTGRPDWWPDWRDETVAIVASGPSAKKAGVELLQDKVRVVAINESWRLVPWADALYGCDTKWWTLHDGVRIFKGLKISAELEACKIYKDIKKITITNVRSDELCIDRLGYVGAGGNSGFQCLNLVVQFGVKRILLVGYDMRIDLGEHWHHRHPMPLSNPHPQDNLPRWRRAIDGIAARLEEMGVTVINCSLVSLLKAYPKMSIEEALRWRDQE